MSAAERFLAEPATAALVARAEALAPTNPFVTAQYLEAQRALGYTPWVVGVEGDGTPPCLGVGFLRRGRLSATFELTSAPPCGADSAFWTGLFAFARRQRVGDLFVNSFASPSVDIPRLPSERARHDRTEFLMDLRVADLLASFSRHHRTRVRKAMGLGLELRRTRDAAALHRHVALHNNSMLRRQARGEDAALQQSTRSYQALLDSQAAELFQVWEGEALLSSLLIARAARGGYFSSSGSSPEGMSCGASHFLVYETARTLQTEGLDVFNCSGARPHETGLRDFKERFGTKAVDLQAASFDLRGGVQRVVARAVGLARDARARLRAAS